jgi:Eukaryotic integral membrane protein (DUF1751)
MGREFRVAVPSFRNASTAVAVGMVLCSIIWRSTLEAGVMLYLVPQRVLAGEVWQLLSWLPAEAPYVMSVLLSAVVLWSMGSQLESMWGRARVLRFWVVTVLLTGVLTVGTALVVPPLRDAVFYGGSILTSITLVGYGCAVWDMPGSFFGFPLTGRIFTFIAIGFMVVGGLMGNLASLVPDAWAVGLTFAYARLGFPVNFFRRLAHERREREWKKRAAHLQVIDGGRRNIGGDSDKYLH